MLSELIEVYHRLIKVIVSPLICSARDALGGVVKKCYNLLTGLDFFWF